MPIPVASVRCKEPLPSAPGLKVPTLRALLRAVPAVVCLAWRAPVALIRDHRVLVFAVSLALAISVGLALEYVVAALALILEIHPYAVNSVRAATISLLSGAFLPLALE